MTDQEKIEQTCDAIGGTLHTHYSGRGMFGQSCMGISIKSPDEILMFMAERGWRNLAKLMSRDSLGKGYICYWQKVQHVEKE